MLIKCLFYTLILHFKRFAVDVSLQRTANVWWICTPLCFDIYRIPILCMYCSRRSILKSSVQRSFFKGSGLFSLNATVRMAMEISTVFLCIHLLMMEWDLKQHKFYRWNGRMFLLIFLIMYWFRFFDRSSLIASNFHINNFIAEYSQSYHFEVTFIRWQEHQNGNQSALGIF